MPIVGSVTARYNVVSKNVAYPAVSNDYVLVDASFTPLTITLPTNVVTGTVVGVKKTDTSLNQVTILPQSPATIDSDPSCILAAPAAAATFLFDGVNWQTQMTAIVNSGTESISAMLTPTYLSGYWYDRRTPFMTQATATNLTAAGTAGTAPLAINTVSYVPHYSHRAVTVDTVGIYASTGAVANATIRLGLYAAASDTMRPSTRLYDFGSFTTTASAMNTLPTSATIPKGWSWWAISQNGFSSGSLWGVPTANVFSPIQGSTTVPVNQTYGLSVPACYETGTGAALAATATPIAIPPSSVIASTPNVYYRVVG